MSLTAWDDYSRERHEADMDTDLPVWIGSTPYDPADVPDLSDVIEP